MSDFLCRMFPFRIEKGGSIPGVLAWCALNTAVHAATLFAYVYTARLAVSS